MTGSLTFNRHDLLDPTSLLSVSYQVKTVPDSGLSVVEALPENNFGKIAYGSVTLSPADWISPQIGFAHTALDSMHSHDLVDISTPSEIRTGSSSLFLKFDPEFTFDAETKAKAAALSLQSRFGNKLSFLFNGLLPDSNYVSTDNMDQGYGFIRHNTNFTVDYDVRKELPLSYTQHDLVSAHGIERYYALTAGSHFLGLPFCDLTLSRHKVDADRMVVHAAIDSVDTNITGIDTTIVKHDTTWADSVLFNRNKDKFSIKVYETSSPIIESLLHIHRCTYQLSYTGYSSRMEEGLSEKGYGSIFYGSGTISPIKSVSVTLQGTYLKNAPGSQYASVYNPFFILQTIDAPLGFDISGRSELDFQSVAGADSSFSTLRRTLNLTIKPGSWWAPLNWLQPLLGFNQTLNCAYREYAPDVQAQLLPDDQIVHRSTTNSIGANVFISNDITWHNNNQFTTADSSTDYYSYNDLKWWFTDKNFWQTRWEYDRDRPRFGGGRRVDLDYNRGFSRFIDTWSPWLQTNTGVSSSITVTDSTSKAQFGPDLTVSINTAKFKFIRSMQINNTVNMSWNLDNHTLQPTPDITYSLFLRVVIMPNIALMANNSFTFEKGAFASYSGMISATAVF